MPPHPNRLPPAAGRHRVSWKARLALLLGSTVLTLGAVETGLRALAWLHDRREAAEVARLGRADIAPPPRGATVKLGQMLASSADRRVIYQFIPNQEVVFLGAPVTINADGFRGADVPRARTPGSFRIVGLGDSVIFGWGVADDQTYLSLVTANLTAHYPATHWEALNTGVPGYNTAQEAAAFEDQWRQWKPDLVIVHFVGNDLDLPNFIGLPRNPWALDHSYLGDWVMDVVRGHPHTSDPFLAEEPLDAEGNVQSDPALVPAQYRDLVGWPAVLGGIRRLHDEAQTDGFRLVVFSTNAIPKQLRDGCAHLGVLCFDASAPLKAAAAQRGLPDANHPPLTLSESDPHPSALGHQILAATLLDGLAQAHALPAAPPR